MSSEHCTIFRDERGSLGVIDDRQLPFKIKRVFWIYQVPKDYKRGQHSHRDCQQAIVCIKGRFELWLDDIKYILTEGSFVIVPTNTKIELTDFLADTICLVLCSEYYNEDEVIKC